jgi:hypothetical protein
MPTRASHHDLALGIDGHPSPSPYLSLPLFSLPSREGSFMPSRASHHTMRLSVPTVTTWPPDGLRRLCFSLPLPLLYLSSPLTFKRTQFHAIARIPPHDAFVSAHRHHLALGMDRDAAQHGLAQDQLDARDRPVAQTPYLRESIFLLFFIIFYYLLLFVIISFF